MPSRQETRDLTGDSRGRVPISPQARLRRDIVLILHSDTQSTVVLSIARKRSKEECLRMVQLNKVRKTEYVRTTQLKPVNRPKASMV